MKRQSLGFLFSLEKCLTTMDGLKYLFLEDRDQPLPSWMADLEDILECPVCLKTLLDPPIHQCENGHCFCNSCHETLQRIGEDCPVCRNRLTNARNLTVEKMLDKLPKIKCRYENCNFKRAWIDTVHQHETDCLFRLVECSACEEGIPLSSISDHLETAHEWVPIMLDNFGIEAVRQSTLEQSGTKTNLELVDNSCQSRPKKQRCMQQPLNCNNMSFFFNSYNDG